MEPKVTLSRGAKLAEVLDTVAQATGLSVIAEIPQVEHRLEMALEDVPVSRALDALATDFDLYGRQGSRVLLFHRRYGDERETLSLELEELQQTGADLHRLVHPFAPYPLSPLYPENQNRFWDSLTVEQRAAMRRPEGLPLAALPDEQRRLWLTVNAAQVFSSQETYSERMEKLFVGWKGAELEVDPTLREPMVYWIAYPRDNAKSNFQAPPPPPWDVRPVSFRGEALADLPQAPKAFHTELKLPQGEIRVDAIAAVLKNRVGRDVRTPDYASKRRVYLSPAPSMRADDLALGIGALYGWTLRPDRSGDWVLGRERPGPAKDPVDLYRKMQACVPPSLDLICRVEERNVGLMTARYARTHAMVLEDAARVAGSTWARLEISRLSPEVNRRLMNQVAINDFRALFSRLTRNKAQSLRVVAPQVGVLKWEGGMLRFTVELPDGRRDVWGYVPNSSQTIVK
ncbi:MAG: hypothetical protein ACK47B_10865 [Armatimonadota bacterium]